MWHGTSIGNFVVNIDWKKLIAGMNRRGAEQQERVMERVVSDV